MRLRLPHRSVLGGALAVALGVSAWACTAVRSSRPETVSSAATAAGTDQAIDISGFAPDDRAVLAEREAAIMAAIDPERLRETVTALAGAPRQPGGSAMRDAAAAVRRRLEAAGLPVESRALAMGIDLPASVRLTTLAADGQESSLVSLDQPGDLTVFLAGAPGGTAEGELVWAREGTSADWAALADAGVDARGRVVLMRAGNLSPRQQVDLALRAGSAAVLIGPAAVPADRDLPYPGGPGRSATAVAGGTLFTEEHGAQARGRRRRRSLHAATRLEPAVSIPAWTVSEETTRALLAGIGGGEAPASWKTATGGSRYLGPGPVRVRLEVDVVPRTVNLDSLLATVSGTDRPEEVVLLSARLDAWGDGAGGGATGAAALLEIADGLGALLESGWQPRRTLVLGFWDGGTLGRLGAREWLASREKNGVPVVAAVELGPVLGSPSVEIGVTDDLRPVADTALLPAGGTGDEIALRRPRGAGDTGALLDLAVPVLEITAPAGPGGVGTSDDTLARLTRFTDRDLVGALTAARVGGRLGLRLADSVWLPTDHAIAATRYIADLQAVADEADRRFDDNPPPFRAVRTALAAYRVAAEDWRAVASRWLAGVGSVPRLDEIEAGRRAGRRGRGARIDEPQELGERLRRAADAVTAAGRAFHELAEAGEGVSCRSLLYCADPGQVEVGEVFTRLRGAVASADRDSTTSELLRLAAAARTAATRLAVARQALTAPAEALLPSATPPEESP